MSNAQVWKYNGVSWTFYSNGQGLNYGSISKIYVDAMDSVWCVGSKLYKFNGITWRDVSINGWSLSTTRDLLLDSNGKFWMASEIGLIRHGGTVLISEPLANSPFPRYHVNGICSDNNNRRWISAEGGVFMYNDTNWTSHKPFVSNDTYMSVLQDHNGNIITSTLNNGIAIFNGASWSNTTYTPSPVGACFAAMDVDLQNDLWIAGGYYDLYKYSGAAWTTYSVPAYITDISILNSNERWLATLGGGLWNMKGTQITVYKRNNSPLPNDTVSCVKTTANGELWVGTANGLIHMNGNVWTVYNSSNSCLPSNGVRRIEIDSQGCLWLLTSAGLVKFLPGVCDIYNTLNSGIIRNIGSELHIDKNGWKWISTQGGVSVFKGMGLQMAVGVQESLLQKHTLKVYPNPADDDLFIECGPEAGAGLITIYCQDGKKNVAKEF